MPGMMKAKDNLTRTDYITTILPGTQIKPNRVHCDFRLTLQLLVPENKLKILSCLIQDDEILDSMQKCFQDVLNAT